MSSSAPESSEVAQAEGEGPEGSDKPPHGQVTLLQQQQKQKQSVIIPKDHAHPAPPTPVVHTPSVTEFPTSPPPNVSVPMPPADTDAYPKEPGLTRAALHSLQLPAPPRELSGFTPNGSTTPSTVESPSDSDDGSWGFSPPSTRPPSRNPSRAPSMSAGASGNKIVPPGFKAAQTEPSSGTTMDAAPALSTSTSVVNKASVTPTPTAPAKQAEPPRSAAPSEKAPSQPPSRTPSRAPSVHSDGGHKFTLKDLMSAGPKLVRRSSARSSASSKKSDSEGGPRSVGGDSGASLLKKYGICERVAIGKGATSVVRLAHKWDRSEEKLYAVKEFRKRRKNETEKEYVKKLTAEFCISSTLHHANIVETVDLVQDENQHWCEVMEYCPGGDLYAAIKRGGMSPSEVECCFKQILTGLAYLHGQGVAHRDIKPENLFFDAQGHLKIGDYGASTVYRLPWETTVHMSTGLCGSEPYIAPEQFLGKPYDARLVDIWACGIVYYCLHFQEMPWRVAQMTDPLYASYAQACAATPASSTANCPPTINNLSPRACRSLIRKMLDPDPQSRSTIESVMEHSWMQSIEICHGLEKPNHLHAHARSVAHTQVTVQG